MKKIKCNEYIRGFVPQKNKSDYTHDRIKGVLEELKDLYGYTPNIEVGEYTYGLPKIKWWGEKTKLKIGKFCSIAREVTIFLGGEHEPSFITTYPFLAYPFEWDNVEKIEKFELRPSKGDIIIGNDVWIGANATILSGVTIGDGAVIGACAVVSKDIPPYSIAVGNPIKIVKKRFSEEVVHILMQIKWWNWPKEKINRAVPLLISGDVGVLSNL